MNTSIQARGRTWKQRLSAMMLVLSMIFGYLPIQPVEAATVFPTADAITATTGFNTTTITTRSVTSTGASLALSSSYTDAFELTVDEWTWSLSTTAQNTGISITDKDKSTPTVTLDSEYTTGTADLEYTVTYTLTEIIPETTPDAGTDGDGDDDASDDGKTVTETVPATLEGTKKGSVTLKFDITVPTISSTVTALSMEVGEEYALYQNLSTSTPVDGASFTYSSSDATVVSISAGTLKALKAGTSTITVKYGEATPITISVAVNEAVPDTSTATVKSITLSDGSGGNSNTLSLYGTKTVTLTATVTMSDGSDAPDSVLGNLSWSGSDGTITVMNSTTSTLNANIFTAGSPGINTIKVAYNSGTSTVTSNDFNISVSGITVTPTEINMTTNSVSEEIVVTLFGNATTVNWTSTNTSLLTVEEVAIDTEAKTHTAVLRSSNSTGEGTVQVSTSDGPSVVIQVSVTEAIADHIIPAYNVNEITPLSFADLLTDFSERSYEVHGEAIDCLSSVQVDTNQGTLFIGYKDEENPGAGVGSSLTYSFTQTPNVKDIVFIPNPGFTGTVAVIRYTGMTTEGNTFYGEIHANLANVDDVITGTTVQSPVELTSEAFSQIANNSGKTIKEIVFTLPDENKALLYYDYLSADNFHHKIVQGESFTQEQIDKITVIPSPGFSGTLILPYVITATDGTTLIGSATVDVAGYGPEGPVVYNTVAGEYVTLVTDHFHTNVEAITGYTMNYLTFTLPDPSVGMLYVNYAGSNNYGSLVTENTAYHASSRSPQISDVSFVPSGGFTGSAKISFVGYDTQGNSYLGTLEVNVGTQALGDINYTCSAMGYVPFYEGDFNQFSQNQTGSDADYIYFPNLPSELQGYLLLGKTTDNPGMYATANTPYYYKDTPLMSKLAFQPLSTYNGLVTIPFEGKSVSGTSFAGTVTVLVTTQNLVRIPYVASHYSPVTLDSADFNVYSVERTQSELDYVKFETPLTTVGTLYYNYVNEDSFTSLVNVTTNYYVNQSHFLNSVTFVPHKDFQGTAQINFTAYGVNGQSFSGILSIYVADGGDPLTYYMYNGDVLYLSSSAIEDYCRSKTGASLNYMTIFSPALSQGRLYQNYSSSLNVHVTTTNTTRYYKSQTPYISNIAFLAADDFLGTVQLPFTAYATDGSTCTGTINITVRPSVASDSVYYYSSFSPIQINEKDIEAVWGSEKVDYIQIHNIPTETQGKLYYENKLTSLATTHMQYYSSASSSGAYINNMIYAPRAGFSGSMVISYTATTVAGRTFSGDICVIVTTGQPSLYFQDMSQHLWATASADYLYFTSVSTGTGKNNFAPSSAISRGDFALMLCNAFRFSGATDQIFSDVPSSAYYYNAIHTLRSLGIASGYDNQFKPEEQISRQDAMVMLSNAMELANKDVKYSSNAVLNQFADSSFVESYAISAFARMVETGVISGSGGRLNPTQSITRAEMAVVIHQAMTC